MNPIEALPTPVTPPAQMHMQANAPGTTTGADGPMVGTTSAPHPPAPGVPTFDGLVGALSLVSPPSDVTEGVSPYGTPVPNQNGMWYERIDTRPWGKQGNNNTNICDLFNLRDQEPPLHAERRFASPYSASCGTNPNIRSITDFVQYSCQLDPSKFGHLRIPASRGALNMCNTGISPYEITQGLINDAALHYLHGIDPMGCTNFQASDVECQLMTGTQAGLTNTMATRHFGL